MNSPLNIIYREYQEGDLPFIRDSYRKSWAAAHSWVPRNIHNREVEKRFAAWESILIAAAPEAPHYIHGWLAYTNDVLHYIYVKNPYRGFGVARDLLAIPRLAYTDHWTPHAGAKIKGLEWIQPLKKENIP